MSVLEEIALRFTLAAAHVLWIGAVVALVVFAAERLFLKTAAARHGVHLAGMILMLIGLPVAFQFSPVRDEVGSAPAEVERAAAPVPEATTRPTEVGQEMPPRPESIAAPDGPVISPTAAAPSAAEPVRASASGHRLWEMLAPWVTGGYVLGLALMALRLCCGLVGSVRLRARSEKILRGPWIDGLERMRDALGTKMRPGLHWSREVAAPVVMGLVKPAILLPVALASRLSPQQVEAVLAHELAHLHRRDTWAVVIQRVAETLLFFHPAVWWMSRRMESAREEACDDRVVAAGCDPADYAEALVICSECRLERRGLSAKWAEGLASTGKGDASLRGRVLRLLGQSDAGPVRLGWIGWVLGVLAIGGVAVALTAEGWRRADLADFDFSEPPMGYEKGIEVADRDQVIEIGGLRFEAAPLQWELEGWEGKPGYEHGAGKGLFLDLGARKGYEIVSFRLFDHESRKLIHDSEWQHAESGEHGRKFHIERIDATNWVRMQETGGRFPERMDVWLRIVTEGSGPTLRLDAREGASATVGGSEIVIRQLTAGSMNGDGQAPGGEMRWDRSSLHDEDRALTLDLENRGKVLDGPYHLVAVKKSGARHPMNHTHFRDFSLMGRHTYVQMEVPLDEVDHFELVPFKARHKFFFNGLHVPRVVLPELSAREHGKIEAWAAACEDGSLSEEEFVERVGAVGPKAMRGLIPLMNSGGSDALAMKAAEPLLKEPGVVEFLTETLHELADEPEHVLPNTRHCCLVLLGKCGGAEHVDLAARFLESQTIAALFALEQMGGERARDHLIAAFERVPTQKWWLVAAALERLGDPAAVPELKRRLAMVELPPSEAFPRATVGAFTSAIGVLSGKEEGVTWHSWSQGQRFVFPYEGPGKPKTFSVEPPSDHYVTLPEGGAEEIWQAMEEATEGPGFTLDGDEVVLFHGLKAMPLWEDGPPYPVSLHEWLGETSHAELLEQAKRDARGGRVAVPASGLLLALAPGDRLHVLSLEKRTEEYQYGVEMRALDPVRQLVAKSPEADGLTEERVCTLHDFGSGAKNGALNLNRAHMVHLDQDVASGWAPDAVLFAEFGRDSIGLGVGAAEEFRLVAMGEIPEADELVEALRSGGAEKLAGHDKIATPRAVFHRFDSLPTERWFGFAARTPGGVPVAGLLKVEAIDAREKTLKLRHCFLKTADSQKVFADGPEQGFIEEPRKLKLDFEELEEGEKGGIAFAGRWACDPPEHLRDHRLALGVMEVESSDAGLVRSHVGAGGSGIALSEISRFRFEVEKGEPVGRFSRLSWNLSRGDERSIGVRTKSAVRIRGGLITERLGVVETGRLRPLLRVVGEGRDLLLVGMLLSPDDPYEGLNAAELMEHWHEVRAERVADEVEAVFREIEIFARRSAAEQAAWLPDFYAGLSAKALNPMVEGVLSSYPDRILEPNREGDAFKGDTRSWAWQLEEAAKESTVAEVAARLDGPLWLRVAARARALQVLERHPEITADLIAADLESEGKSELERATAVIVSLQLEGFSERLLELWLADDERSPVAWSALIFMRDPVIKKLVMQRVEEDPEFILRGSGLLEGPLTGGLAEPLLLELLDSGNEGIRYHAAAAMRGCRDARLSEPLAGMAADEREWFRRLAAEMAANLPDAAFGDIRADLLPLLRDDSDPVRFEAVSAFAERKDDAAGPVILEALGSELSEDDHKVATMQSLSALSGQSWGYDLHQWGPEKEGNREAMERFKDWLERRDALPAREEDQ